MVLLKRRRKSLTMLFRMQIVATKHPTFKTITRPAEVVTIIATKKITTK